MYRNLFLCALLVATLLIAGCAQQINVEQTVESNAEPSDAEPAPTATTAPATAVPTETEANSEGPSKMSLGDAVIAYERSGGIAGETDTWKIYADGRIVDGDGNEWQVAPAQVEQVLADLESMGFFELDGAYMPLDTCCDRYTYTLAVRHDDSTHRVTTMDDADAPDTLWNAIDAVNAVIQDAQS